MICCGQQILKGWNKNKKNRGGYQTHQEARQSLVPVWLSSRPKLWGCYWPWSKKLVSAEPLKPAVPLSPCPLPSLIVCLISSPILLIFVSSLEYLLSTAYHYFIFYLFLILLRRWFRCRSDGDRGTGGQGTGDSSLLIGPGGETIHSPITMIIFKA